MTKDANKEIFMYHMIQKCGYLKTLEVFFKEPTKIHFIREISKKVGLAQTSVRNHVKFLFEKNMIIKKKAKPFDGYISNRDNDEFIFYKMIYNLSSIKLLRDFIVRKLFPKAIVLFGSYLRGEDIETSDIDLFVLTNSKKEIDFSYFEKVLERKINVLYSKSLELLDKVIQDKIKDGFVLEGELYG